MTLRDQHLQKVSIEKLQELIALRKQNALLLKVLAEAEELCEQWPEYIKPEDAITIYYFDGMTCNEDFSPHYSGLQKSIRAYRASESEKK